jgi:hypothetical protein
MISSALVPTLFCMVTHLAQIHLVSFRRDDYQADGFGPLDMDCGRLP